MSLLVLIFVVGLLTPALTLTCHECPLESASPCASGGTTTTVCSSPDHRCASLRRSEYTNGVVATHMFSQKCVLPEECTGMSYNEGRTRYVINVKCCTTDRCNSQPAVELIENSPNGKRCSHCNGTSCGATLDCLGDKEDYCFTTTNAVKTLTMKGCVSKNVCDLLPADHLIPGIGGQLKCCKGDLCNSATITSAGLLLLVAPLLITLVL